LFEAIINIEMTIRNNDEPTRQLISTYRNADPETKRTIQMTFRYLLHLGMFMRGWIGSGDYPVTSAPVPPGREIELAVNVTNAIGSYESSCRSLGRIGTQINNLPLVIYKDKEYQVSNQINEGLTIQDRINIIKEGERTRNVQSCIRLSSNWICSSAHKYIISLGLPEPFDVFNLRHIQ
jgi:hypothetical protein